MKKKYDNQVGKFLNAIHAIETLVQKDLLYIDYRKPYVALSLRLHLAYIDDEIKLMKWKYRLLKKLGLVERDVRYKSFLQTVLAYINYRRGVEGMSEYSPKQKLDFLVMNMDNTAPLFVGAYMDGEVDYVSVGKD